MELSVTSDLSQKAPCVALVPLGAVPARPACLDHSLTRPDPRFVTHLIAMAASSPQTRLLRRAAPETARAAYQRAANQNGAIVPSGVKTRQVA
jgi:hypothetical protein